MVGVGDRSEAAEPAIDLSKPSETVDEMLEPLTRHLSGR